jgi:hypothetical protein
MAEPASHRRRSRLLTWPLLFVGILAVHSLAIYLFTRGFLLTRTELDLHSSRDDRPRDVSPGCASWPRPAVDRLVIVVLDALRCSSPRPTPSVLRILFLVDAAKQFVVLAGSISWHLVRSFKVGASEQQA